MCLVDALQVKTSDASSCLYDQLIHHGAEVWIALFGKFKQSQDKIFY